MKLFTRRPRLALLAACCVVLGGATFASDVGSPDNLPAARLATPHDRADFTVLTYNVKGLPWPAARGRPEALRKIGEQLSAMRKAGVQPGVVVLQEAFVAEAKAIGIMAGYPYSVSGPDQAMADRLPASGEIPRRWYIGETQGKQLDSGLVILSDYPLTQVRRAAFGPDDCAGLDCLAAKGMVIARVSLPGDRHVSVATTHLNSAGASKAPRHEADAAFARQTRELAAFLRENWNRNDPLILAGDLNVGKKPRRAQSLAAARDAIGTSGLALANCLDTATCAIDRRPEAEQIRKRAKDMQIIAEGRHGVTEPIGAAIPFPVDNGLSDHAGFSISYRFLSTAG